MISTLNKFIYSFLLFLHFSCSTGNDSKCLSSSEQDFIDGINSRFNSIITVAYGSGNYEDFLLDISESSLPPEFFIESPVFEFITSPSNSDVFSNLWKSKLNYYVLQGSFFDCMVKASNSQEIRDIINSVKDVPEVTPWLVALSMLDIIPESEYQTNSFVSFLAVYLFGQTALNINQIKEPTSDPVDQKVEANTNEYYQGELIRSEVDILPEFIGGTSEFYNYLTSNLTYPIEARQLGIEGKVYVKFLVTKDGSVVNVESKKGIGYGCDKEAVRVIKESPKWKPGYYMGNPVVVRIVIPIIFSLNNAKTS